MLSGLKNSFEAVYRDSSVTVLMISSSVPRAFCAGADFKERKTMTAYEVQDFVNSLSTTFAFLEGLHIFPTIAVIEGAALGGGLEMALSCNLRALLITVLLPVKLILRLLKLLELLMRRYTQNL